MTCLTTFNQLKTKTSDKATKESLLNLLSISSKAAATAVDYLKSLDKIKRIYFKEENIGVYGIIDDVYYYKEFTNG